uniref:GTPase Era, mitochondrial n=1 Tax=Sipha flava TaxID=143950 RepID=A0A2S2Q172_9HEMI
MAKCMIAVLQSVVLKRSLVSPGVARVLCSRKYNSSNPEWGEPQDNGNAVDPEQQKLLKVAIIGVPNAGKSSLINSIVGRNICPYSRKVHTTRAGARAVLSIGDTQLVFLDTPGLVDSNEIEKYNLDKAFANDSVNSIEEADIIGVVHDVSNRYTRSYLDPKVLRLLHLNQNKDSFLILNKIDLLRSKIYLLDLARSLTCFTLNNFHIPKPYMLTPEEEKRNRSKVQERRLEEKVKKSVGWGKFNDVFMISAVLNQGSSDIREYLLQRSKPSPWLFSKDEITDKEDYKLVLSTIESILLDDLPNEVPYNLKVELEYYEISREGNLHIVVLIHCKTPRIEKLIMGKRGQRIRNIARTCEQHIRNLFLTDVFLKMVVTDKAKSINHPITD